MNTSKYLRELAKTDYYQTLYNQVKELHLKLFKNDTDLSDIQIRFIGFLNFYSNLFMDCALGEIGDIVFADIIYEDAYMYYKHNKKEDSDQKLSSNRLSNGKEKLQHTDQWVFKRPLKKVT